MLIGYLILKAERNNAEDESTAKWILSSAVVKETQFEDATGTAAFLGFDTEVAKITLIQDFEAAQIVGIGVKAQVDTDLPRSLADIVENTYTFQLRFKDFNFTANHQTCTITRIFSAPELAPVPIFVVDAHVPGAALAEAVVPVSDVTVTNTSKVAEQATTHDGSLSGSLAIAREQVDLEDNASKIARLEGVPLLETLHQLLTTH
ncbi:unnamed protein product [Eruca vesicaria subsp. sativa]|uniref:Uncharacterized protein n=1 Tax=Eruca vesicaria subsp. sativa TaxID=29727 RepID=A0ABC8LNL0_ERUVS|nr:unnamed protein product [Eruca vesicaria subsp. sativa]